VIWKFGKDSCGCKNASEEEISTCQVYRATVNVEAKTKEASKRKDDYIFCELLSLPARDGKKVFTADESLTNDVCFQCG